MYVLKTYSGTCLVDGIGIDEVTARDYCDMVGSDLPTPGARVRITTGGERYGRETWVEASPADPRTVNRHAIFAAVKSAYLASVESGSSHYRSVLVYPDGTISTVKTVSELAPTSPAHPGTVCVWSWRSDRQHRADRRLSRRDLEQLSAELGIDWFARLLPDLESMLQPTGLTLVG